MLKDFPIYFNETKVPTPAKWEKTFNTIEKVNQTEAGTDQVLVVRYDKLTVSAQFNCSSRWAATFAVFRDAGPITVKDYDIKKQGYGERKMRIRNFRSSLIENSEKVTGTEGLYTITFNLEEY